MMMGQQEKSEWDIVWVPSCGELSELGFTPTFYAGSSVLNEEYLALTSYFNRYDGYICPQEVSKKAIMEVDAELEDSGGTGFVCSLGDGETGISCCVNGTKVKNKYDNVLKTLDYTRNIIRLEYDSSGVSSVKINGELIEGYNGVFLNSNGLYSKGNLTTKIYSIKIKFE